MTLGAPAYDVLVVGAGPAGASCAAQLAAGGLAVALLDRQAPPRYKTCGGGLVWKARRALGGDLTEVVERECRAAELHLWDTAQRFRVRREEPIVSMTMRSRLDHRIARRAVAAGAELLAPLEVRAARRGATGITLATDQGEITGRIAVAADGVGSRVARTLGWPPLRRLAAALESEIQVDRADLACFGTARFDFGPLAAGYAWVFPKRDHLSIGCLSVRRSAVPLSAALEAYLEHLRLRPVHREDHGYAIPLAPRSAPAARGGVFLVGDAAGLADPVTGEGISWALASGELAARAILAHPTEPEAASRAYCRALERELLRELAAARRLAYLLYGPGALRRLAFRRCGRPLVEAVTDLFVGRESFRSLTGRPGRWLRFAARLVTGSSGSGQREPSRAG